jgi:hypothetical protein
MWIRASLAVIIFIGCYNLWIRVWIRVRIRRIHMLGLLDPDPDLLVRGVDPDPDLAPEPSIIMQNSKKSLDTYYL